jgi:outer membrane protein OmpA-like peptidoglycan-associated protein
MAQDQPSEPKTYVVHRFVITLCLVVGAYFVPWVHGNVNSVFTTLARPNSCAPLAKRHLRVGITPWVGFGGALLSEDGWQDKVDLVSMEDSDWEEAFSGCADSEKKVDVLWTTIDSWAAQYPVLRAKMDAQHAPIAVMQIARSSEACALMVAPGVVDLKAQADQKIGAPALTAAHAIALRMVNRKNAIFPIPSAADALQHFLDGQLVGVALCEPYLQRLGRMRPQSERADQKTEQVFILIARPEAVQQMIKLQNLAQSWLQSNEVSPWKPNDIIGAFRRREEAGLWENDADDATLNFQLNHTQMSTFKENKAMFDEKSGKMDYDAQFEEAYRRWVNAGMVKQPANASESRKPDIITKLMPPAREELCDFDKAPYRQTVSFALGKYEVQDEGPIRAALSTLSDYQNPQVCVIGYTDRSGRGDGFDNQKLSERRADEVAKYFRDIPGMRIIAIGRGDRDLIENTDGPSRRNRRAEIRVVPDTAP